VTAPSRVGDGRPKKITMRRLLLAPAALLLALLSGAPAPAAEASCDAYASPGESVQALVDSLSAGETGCLRGGTFTHATGDYIAKFKAAGTAEAPITLRSAPGERARLVGVVMFDAPASHVHLSDLEIEGTGVQNTIKIYSADAVVENNDISNGMRGDSCMILGGSAGRAVRPIVRGNTFHDCGSKENGNKDHGIYAARNDDAQISGNTFTNQVGYAIQLYPDAQRAQVTDNVIDGGPDTIRGGIVIGGDTTAASSGNVVERNIITHTATQGVFSYWPGAVGTDNVVRNNCFWETDDEVGGDAGLAVAGNIVADPSFANRAARDYTLAQGSGCRGVHGSGVDGGGGVEGGIADPELVNAFEIDTEAFFASGGRAALSAPVGCAGRSRAKCRSRR
jgi:hypothetical protein